MMHSTDDKESTTPAQLRDPDVADMVLKMAMMGATEKDIAWVLNLPIQVVSTTYYTDIELGRSQLRLRLKAKQIEMALQGDARMLVWLGKQYAGQVDKVEHTHTEEADNNNTVNVTRRIISANQDQPPQGINNADGG